MDAHERRNVNRVFRTMAREWGCPVWMVRQTIQKAIDQSWENSMHNSEARAVWCKYFPDGKPTPEQYILFQGRKFETGEDMPELLDL